VAVDLRHDWAGALREAGFDATAPSACSAEGLLPFLPPEAQDALLDNIAALSAPGSRLATEKLPDASRSVPAMADRMKEATDRWRAHGFDVEMTDRWYAGDRNDVIEYLNSHGWSAGATGVIELLAAQGLSLEADDQQEATFASLGYVTATRR
jgi:methyltransferase (TIGR00027 family)